MGRPMGTSSFLDKSSGEAIMKNPASDVPKRLKRTFPRCFCVISAHFLSRRSPPLMMHLTVFIIVVASLICHNRASIAGTTGTTSIFSSAMVFRAVLASKCPSLTTLSVWRARNHDTQAARAAHLRTRRGAAARARHRMAARTGRPTSS